MLCLCAVSQIFSLVVIGKTCVGTPKVLAWEPRKCWAPGHGLCVNPSLAVAIVFELRDELKISLEAAKPKFAVHLQNNKFVSRLAYLVDIFEG